MAVENLRLLLRERDGLTDRVSQEFAEGLAEVLRELRRPTRGLLRTFAQNGRLVPDLDAQVKAELYSVVRTLLDESGYTELLDRMDARSLELLSKLQQKMRTIGLDASFASADINKLDALVSLQRTEFSNLGDRIAMSIETELRRQILAGETVQQAATALADAVGVTHAQATTLANSSLLNFHQQSLNVASDRTGAEKFLYIGPDDGLTRPFCDVLLNKWLSRKEISKLRNGQLPGVYRTRGGYNCRHSWMPLFGGQAEDEGIEHGSVAAANAAGG